MSETIAVDDNIAILKSPSIGIADEFFDAEEDGKQYSFNLSPITIWTFFMFAFVGIMMRDLKFFRIFIFSEESDSAQIVACYKIRLM